MPDLLVDRDAESLRPYAWMCYNFECIYPLVIWGLKLFAADERFNVPQVGLTGVPLRLAFGWAYYHFILEDGAQLPDKALSLKVAPHYRGTGLSAGNGTPRSRSRTTTCYR